MVNSRCWLESRTNPAAVTSVDDPARTLVSTFWLRLPVVITFGLGITDQFVPSKCSTSVSTGTPGATLSPTAQMSVGEFAVTAASTLPVLFAFGLGTTLHTVPFQCSINVKTAPFAAA